MSSIYSTTPGLVLAALIAWTLYTLLQRLFFHPLRHIPGPWLYRLSTWPTAYHDLRGGQLPFALKQLHSQYGPIIRPTPDEVHISDPDFLDTIYAMRNRNQPFAGGLMVQQSVGGAESWDLHKLRRVRSLWAYAQCQCLGRLARSPCN
jgi:hypothetical protein